MHCSSSGSSNERAARVHAPPRRLVVALCASAKKHAQSFDALRRYTETHNNNNNNKDDEDNSDDTRTRHAHHEVCFMTLHYDAEEQRMVLLPASPLSPCHALDVTSSTSTTDTTAAVAVADADVDVVVHKVTTFADAAAVCALRCWCEAVTAQRCAQRRPALVLVDELARVERVVRRQTLYACLTRYRVCNEDDSSHRDGTSHAAMCARGECCVARRVGVRIPRSYTWSRGTHTLTRINATNTSSPSTTTTAVAADTAAVCRTTTSSAAPRWWWWMAKPDEATGPSYTHHFVVWRSAHAHAHAPPHAAQALLPSPVRRFVLQQLCVHAVPVVVKVYCIDAAVYVDVRPTSDFVARLRPPSRDEANKKSSSSSSSKDDDDDVVLCINSQDSSVFCARRGDATHTTAAAAEEAKDEEQPPHDKNDDEQQQKAQEHATHAEASWSSAVVARCWAAHFAPGTCAHAMLVRLARHLARPDVCGMSLYGFDVLLLPPPPPRAHDDVNENKAQCDTDDDDDDDDDDVYVNATSSGAVDVMPVRACFDVVHGTATSLLQRCVPVLVDVNYYPGYKGVAEASAQLHRLLQHKAAAAAAAVDAATATAA